MVLFKILKYGGLAIACLIVKHKIEKCITKCLEKPDEWDIKEECVGTEIAAGYMRKKAKGSNTWSKRYIVIDKNKIIYY